MALLNRKRTLLAKIETVYGTDSAPTGAANAILCRNLDITPLEGQTVSRDLVRPFYGNSEQLPTSMYVKASFEVEMAGSGTAGVAPAWGPLLRACGFAETILAAAHTGTAQAGSTTTTIRLAAAASATNDIYLGDPVRTTGGTGSGQTRTIIDYDGATKTATVDSAWTVTPDATTTYSIDANVSYVPVSAGFESNTLYFNVDGVLHRLLGSRGTVNLGVDLDGIPVFKFEFSGIYQAVTDTAAPVVTLSAWQQPLPVNKVNTPVFTVHGLAAVAQSLSFDVGNEVVFRSLVGGAESVLITDRKPKGSLSIEAVNVATRDFWTIARNASLGAVVLEHGLIAGNKMRITAPRTQIVSPKYGDLQGVTMLQADLTVLPIAGNDDILICAL